MSLLYSPAQDGEHIKCSPLRAELAIDVAPYALPGPFWRNPGIWSGNGIPAAAAPSTYASQRQVWMKLKRSIRSWNLRTGRYGKACPKKRWNSSAPVWKRYVITWRTVIRQKGRFNRMYPAVQRCHGPAGCSGQLSSQISADVVQHLAAQKFKGLPCPSC